MLKTNQEIEDTINKIEAGELTPDETNILHRELIRLAKAGNPGIFWTGYKGISLKTNGYEVGVGTPRRSRKFEAFCNKLRKSAFGPPPPPVSKCWTYGKKTSKVDRTEYLNTHQEMNEYGLERPF